MTKFGKLALAGGLVALVGVGGAVAQNMRERGMERGFGGPGFGGQMMGRMAGPGMLDRLCLVDQANMTARIADRMVERLKLTDAQKPPLKALQDAAAKAMTDAKVICADKPDLASANGRMAAMERRLDLAASGVKAIRPKFDAFYAALDDAQKKQLDAMGPGAPRMGRGEHHAWGGHGRGGPGFDGPQGGPGGRGGPGGFGGWGGPPRPPQP